MKSDLPIYVAKRKALVTAQLICAFAFAKCNQRTNGPVNAHLISWPSKAQNIQNLENLSYQI